MAGKRSIYFFSFSLVYILFSWLILGSFELLGWWKLLVFSTWYLLGLFLCFSIPATWSNKRIVLTVLLLGLVVRCVLIQDTIWLLDEFGSIPKPVIDGEVSPYLHSVDYYDDSLSLGEVEVPLQGFSHLPPFSQFLIIEIYQFENRELVYLTVLVLVDTGIVLLLFILLTKRNSHPRWVALYALNPMVILSFYGSGNMMMIALFFVLLSVVLAEKNLSVRSWFMLGVAIQFDMLFLLLIPLFCGTNKFRDIWSLMLPLLTAFLIYPNFLFSFIQGNLFSIKWDTGISFFELFSAEINATGALWFSFAVLILYSVYLVWKCEDLRRSIFVLIGALVLCSPLSGMGVVCCLLPFACLFPGMASIILLGLLGLFIQSKELLLLGDRVGSFHGVVVLIWAVAGLIFVWQERFGLMRLLSLKKYPVFSIQYSSGSGSTLSVVVPTYNEADNILCCLDSMLNGSCPPDEIIISDGGSRDETLELLKSYPIQIVNAPKGRGRQIRRGVEVCTCDYILVMHGDSTCLPETIGRIKVALDLNVNASGGAVGQVFDDDTLPVLITETLNYLRGFLFRQSFGDQGQFFRRSCVADWGGFPDLLLMEDVELSELLNKSGQVLFLGGGIMSSSRRWSSEHWFTRYVKVMYLVLSYRYYKILGKNPQEKLYEIYYGKN